MKRTVLLTPLLLLVAMLSSSAQENPAGTVTYSLPQTSLRLDVQAVKECFFAGPYAKYAEKFLGIKAKETNSTTYRISSVTMTPCIEADAAHRFTVNLPSGAGATFLQLSTQGLISTSDGSFGREAVWRFPSESDADFSGKGLSSNYTAESATLYQNVKEDAGFSRLSVSQNIVVAKTMEQKAKEASDMILKLRSTRINIVTGNTDANYSGESMGAAIAEISRLEKEYLSMFIGYTETEEQQMNFDIVPQADSRSSVFVAFRLSDANGLVSADDVSGKPYLLDIVPEALVAAQASGKGSSKGNVIYYRTPAVCNVKLTDGVNILLQTRVPIYQFGSVNTYPIAK